MSIQNHFINNDNDIFGYKNNKNEDECILSEEPEIKIIKDKNI